MPVTPLGVYSPDGTEGYDLTVDLAAMATSIDGAIETNGIRSFASSAARDAAYPTPSNGRRIYRSDLGWNQIYFTTANVATAGWYDERTLNFYKAGTELNPVPATITDISNSSVTFGLNNPTYCSFTFGARIQANLALTVDVHLNIDSADVAQVTDSRQESGGEPRVSVAGIHGVLLAAGSHTVKLRAISTAASVSVAGFPRWSMVGTIPILGTYV